MEPVLVLLAAIGFIAIFWRFLRALFRTFGRSAEVFLARGAANARAQRGDLTGMDEATDWLAAARRARWRSLAQLGVWLALLIVPALTPWSLALYATYSGLWLVLRGLEQRRRHS